MDIKIIIIGSILVILCILPLVFAGRGRKKKEKKLIQSLFDFADRNDCSITEHEICGDVLIGVDESNFKLFFMKQMNQEVITQLVNLKEFQICKVKNTSRGVNNTSVIHQNPKVAAINSAIEIDLSGQICADSIGSKIYSGVGGQMDFIRGASLSEGGKPIIAMPSITNNGLSKLVAYLKPGAGVVTTRAHVHYVVTEYGVADLYGKNLSQRAKALIAIAHPTHQEELEKSAFELYGKL